MVVDPILIIAISAATWAFANSNIALRAGIDFNFVGASLCGVLGAYLAVLLRNMKQNTTPLNSPLESILYSINKIILGFISGVLVFMIFGNIILKNAKNDAGVLFGIAALAGFFEYFLPGIIRSLRTKLLGIVGPMET